MWLAVCGYDWLHVVAVYGYALWLAVCVWLRLAVAMAGYMWLSLLQLAQIVISSACVADGFVEAVEQPLASWALVICLWLRYIYC